MNLMTFLRNANEAGEPDFQPPATGPLCADPCAEHMLRSGSYCKLLRDVEGGAWEQDAIVAASAALQRDMALVPSGSVQIQPISSHEKARPTSASQEELIGEAFFIDRYAVTNEQFERFVAAGGYRQEEFWPEDILPLLFQFVDQTKSPGPMDWSNGAPRNGLRDHPVVGICWYEANAYALWAGKALPTSGQWQRAGTWWKPGVRHPWGNSFEQDRTNTGGAGHDRVVPVSAYEEGATSNGIYQLIGNVWEWVYASFNQIEEDGQYQNLDETLGEIRGGAYDTYLPTQANCLFRTGQPLLHRADNIGFRCSVPATWLPEPGLISESQE